MDKRDICLNLLAEDSFIPIAQVLLDYFKEDKNSIFLLAHLISQHKFLAKSNLLELSEYFYSTIDAIEKKYYLNDHAQRKAMKRLETLGFIHTIKKGMPAKRHFKLNFDKIYEILQGTPKEKVKRSKADFYNAINSSIPSGWEVYKKTINNIDAQTALGLYFWKRIYDFYSKSSTYTNSTEWIWTSELYGIFHFWIIQRAKTGAIDYSYIKDYITYLHSIQGMGTSQDHQLKMFTFWFKEQMKKAPSKRLTDPEAILRLTEELQ